MHGEGRIREGGMGRRGDGGKGDYVSRAMSIAHGRTSIIKGRVARFGARGCNAFFDLEYSSRKGGVISGKLANSRQKCIARRCTKSCNGGWGEDRR